MKFIPILAASLASFSSLISASATATFTRAPYIQQATDQGITIVWRTHSKISPVIHFGSSPESLDARSEAANINIRSKTAATAGSRTLFRSNDKREAPDNTLQYEVTLSGLKANTRYYYAVYDGEKRLTPADKSYYFRTHPTPGSNDEALIWIVGDSGTGGAAQRQVHKAMRQHLAKQNRQLDLYLHVGDMAYGSGTDPEFSKRFFDIYQTTLRNTVCWPAMGNHEGYTSRGKNGIGPYYDAYVCPTKGESGGLASGTEAYYSFDYGNIHFICLDSHDLDRSSNGAMARWLRADLEQTKAEWLIAFWHHPPYTKGSHNSDTETQLIEMREQILPILEAGGVDCVFTGHSHIYERSMLIDKAYSTPTVAENAVLDDGDGDPNGDGAYRKSAGLQPHNGSVHIVAGHGGKISRVCGISPVMKKMILEFGSCLMEVKDDTLVCSMLNHQGQVRDVFHIVKQGTVTAKPIAQPWRLTQYPQSFIPAEPGMAMPKQFSSIVAKHSQWRLLAGKHAAENWWKPEFDVSKWPLRKAGFGYGDKDDNTELQGMRNQYTTVYSRKNFQLNTTQNVGLAIRFDDAFIAYINGKEAIRVGVENGSGARASGLVSHEAKPEYRYFPIDSTLLKQGKNTIAIEGHNMNLSSSDFTLDPFIIRPTK